jgi:hypothetical protein
MTAAPRISNSASRAVIVGTTALLGAAGAALIFAPAEIGGAIGLPDLGAVTILVQLYGAALFGLAMTGWMVRDAVVGGIFGRSYVVGNTSHALVGAMTLLRPALAAGALPGLRAIAAAYWLLAMVFGYLMFVAAPGARQ